VELRVYKSGQGRYVRLGTAIGAALIALVLSHYLYVLMERHVPKPPQAWRDADGVVWERKPRFDADVRVGHEAWCNADGVLMERDMPEFAARARVYLIYTIPAVFFAGLAVTVALMLNKPSMADFLIATESEMKKVSWSSRAELMGSTMVVIGTIFVMAALITLADNLFISVLTHGLGLW
jgi:preprotein translocase SecE subunit